MTSGQATSGLKIVAVGVGLLSMALPVGAAGDELPKAEPTQIPAPAASQSSSATALSEIDDGGAHPPAPEERANFVERVLHEREILGTRFRGNLFIDGLPVSPDGVQIGSSLELRRARLGFSRELPLRWDLIGQVELSNGRMELKDLYLRRHFGRVGAVTVGNQSEPMGLGELTSPLSLPLLEPSMATALVPGRNFGITLGNRHHNFQYVAGAFGSGTQQEGRRDVGSAFTGRLTHRVIAGSGEVRHLGFALSDRKLGGNEQFRSVPEVGVGQAQLVDTGSIEGARKTQRASFEYIQTFGRLSLLGELLRVRVSRDPGAQLRFGGAYIEATWMVWGEGPLYDDADAVLSRAPVTSKATWGDAWGRGNLAVTARLSRIDISDDDIQGGTETNVTLGLAWDLNQRSRLAANLVHFVELTGPNAQAEKSLALALRFQYAW